MEVRKGYKQTELGVIPEDWDVKKFVEVTNAITCGVAATPKYVSEAIGKPFLSASHVQNGEVVARDFKYIPLELYKQITKNNKPEKGDILYTRVGVGIGEAGVIEVDFDFAIYVSLTLIKPKKNLNSYFLKSLLNSNHYRFLAKRDQFAGGGVQNLNVQIVREFPIPLPSPTEQTAIASALSDADALISGLENLIDKKRNIKQGAMQKLLAPKKDWVVKKLGEVAHVVMGQSPDSEFYNTERIGLPLIQGNADVENRKTIIRTYTSEITKKAHKGDIIMSVRAPVGEIAVAAFDCCLGRGVCSISYSNDYLYHYLIYFEKSWSKISTGSTFDSVNSKEVSALEIPIPKLEEEQIRIATILSDMDAEISCLETKLEKYKKLKQGMMQNLLTGKIRLV